MLRYIAFGHRDFRDNGPLPDRFAKRLNWEFFAVLDGTIRPQYEDGAESSFRRKTLWLTHPKYRYRWQSKLEPCLRCVFQFSDIPLLLAKKFEEADLRHLAISLDDTELREIAELHREVEPHYFNPHELSYLAIQKVLFALCLLIARDMEVKTAPGLHRRVGDRVHAAESYFVNHLQKRPTVEEVANAVHVSPSQLRRYFKETYGKSPNSVFRAHRMQEVTRLLTETDKTLEDIAHSTGFSNMVDFHRSFKAAYESTPDQWRHEAGRKSEIPAAACPRGSV